MSRFYSAISCIGSDGLDCLQSSGCKCNIAGGSMLFMEPKCPADETLGAAFHLDLPYKGHRAYAIQSFFMSKPGKALIDTACYTDGAVRPRLFARQLKEQSMVSTNETKTPGGLTTRIATFPKASFGGETYSELKLNTDPWEDVIGLGF